MIINLSSKVNRYNFAGLQLIDKVLFNKRITHDAGWSSLVARRAHNPKVVGSNPTPATNDRPSFLLEKWGFLFCREVESGTVYSSLICYVLTTFCAIGFHPVNILTG